jgi:hypothetical protein
LAFVKRIGRLVEASNRSVAARGQLANAVVGLLRQHDVGFRSSECGLARCDHLGPRASIDVGQLRLGDDLGGHRLLPLRDGLWVVDSNQHRAGGDVLAATDRDVSDPSIHARRDVEPRGIHLTLHQQRLRSDQIPYR